MKTPLARSLARSIVLALVSVSALAPSLAANPLHPKKKVEAPPPPPTLPQPVPIASSWQLQDVAKVQQPGAVIASDSFKPAGWYAATVPGTVLTTLVNNKVYPEPLYGENNRPEVIPESLNKTSYW